MQRLASQVIVFLLSDKERDEKENISGEQDLCHELIILRRNTVDGGGNVLGLLAPVACYDGASNPLHDGDVQDVAVPRRGKLDQGSAGAGDARHAAHALIFRRLAVVGDEDLRDEDGRRDDESGGGDEEGDARGFQDVPCGEGFEDSHGEYEEEKDGKDF